MGGGQRPSVVQRGIEKAAIKNEDEVMVCVHLRLACQVPEQMMV